MVISTTRATHESAMLPPKSVQHNGGRKWADDRAVIAGIVCVDILGSSWAQIPATLGTNRLDAYGAPGPAESGRSVGSDSGGHRRVGPSRHAERLSPFPGNAVTARRLALRTGAARQPPKSRIVGVRVRGTYVIQFSGPANRRDAAISALTDAGIAAEPDQSVDPDDPTAEGLGWVVAMAHDGSDNPSPEFESDIMR